MCPSEIVSITAMFYPINTMAICCSVHIVGMVAIYTALKLTETMFLSIFVNLQIGVNLNFFLLQYPSIFFTFDYPFWPGQVNRSLENRGVRHNMYETITSNKSHCAKKSSCSVENDIYWRDINNPDPPTEVLMIPIT